MDNKSFRRKIHYAHVSLAIIIPTLSVGVILLRDAHPAIMQAYAMVVFFGGIVLMLVLSERDERRRGGDKTQ